MVTVKVRRRTSVSQAKNVMLRAMHEILDPSPLDDGQIWDHFESRCAYCDLSLDSGGRSVHIDHAIAAGGNHLGNLVLAIATNARRDHRAVSPHQPPAGGSSPPLPLKSRAMEYG